MSEIFIITTAKEVTVAFLIGVYKVEFLFWILKLYRHIGNFLHNGEFLVIKALKSTGLEKHLMA
jgi:hypothetical protein